MDERSMELFLVLFTIILFVLLNSLTYILGALATPVGSVFLGTVHWTGDYFSYLSQFAQGISSWFFSYDLYTSDFPHPTLVGWMNVFLGRIFHLIGINHLMAYQLSIVIFAATFLGVSYLLIREIFPDRHSYDDTGSYKKRIVAFILFVTSNALPKIIWEGGKWSLSYYDFWFNNGLPFNRLGGVPHHLIARTAISLALLLAIWWWKNIYYSKGDRPSVNISWFLISGFLILGFVLASVEPVHWGLVAVILFVTAFAVEILDLINQVSSRKSEIRISKSETNSNDKNSKHYLTLPSPNRRGLGRGLFEYLNFSIVGCPLGDLVLRASNLFPSVFFFLAGLPMAIYLKNIVSHPPYSQLAVWEATQQLHIDFITFLLGNGPVAILGLVGLIMLLRRYILTNSADRQNLSKLIGVVFTFLTIFLFFSPIPQVLKIVNVRFLPATTTLFLACMATEAIFALSKRFQKRENIAVGLLVGLMLLITIPLTLQQLTIRTKTDPNNAFFYVSKDVITAYQKAQKLSSINDTFLVVWPFNWSFPGIVGRRVYEGHILATIDYYRKEKQTRDFFFGEMKSADMQKFLTSEKIDYVLTYPWTRNINDIPILEKLYDNYTLAIYKVIK